MSNSELTLADFEKRGSSLRTLIRELRADRFPGAVMLCGPAGMGKTALSRLLAAALLCREGDPSARPCLACKACRRALSGTHPDILTPQETKKKSIGVDEIRDVIGALQSFALESDRRVVLLDDADRLTVPAQNSLLKSVEDHAPGTHFILTTANEANILSTIRSRVLTVRIAPLDTDTLAAWLTREGVQESEAREAARLSDGNPGLALQLSADESDRALRTLVYETVFQLTGVDDIPTAEHRLKDLKDDSDAWFAVLERELRLLMRGEADGSMAAPWRSATPLQLSRVLRLVLRAERQRASNVNIQAALSVLLQSIVEDMTVWPSL